MPYNFFINIIVRLGFMSYMQSLLLADSGDLISLY